jgi:hypothetical protein
MSDPVAIARGARAKVELVETEAAFEAVRAAMIKRLVSTATAASDERERLYHGVQVLDAVRAALVKVVNTGKLEEAAEELERIQRGEAT